MEDTTMIALISALGTFLGSVVGIAINSSLTRWRLEKLEEKVDRHNHAIERIALAERDIDNMEKDIKSLKQQNVA